MQWHVQVWVSRLAALLAALCAAPALVALGGGADLDLPFARVSWYDALGPVLALATGIAAAVWQPRVSDSRARARLATALYIFATGSIAVATWAATLGGFQTDSISVRHALRPALLGATSLLLAYAAASGASRRTLVPAALALFVGSALTAAAVQADRRELREAIDSAGTVASLRSDVVFIVIDTLRADALGFARPGSGGAASGDADSPTPTLDALARESVSFDAAFAQAPWTLPSMMSLVTSRYASSLHPGWRGAWPTRVPLEAEPAVLAGALREAGYHTAGFVKNPMLAEGTGFERGYDVYEWVGGDDADDHSARQLVDASLRWAEEFARARRERAGKLPFFLSLHFMDPHAHYRPPSEFLSEEARRYAGAFDGHTSTLKRMTRGGRLPAAGDVEQMRRLYRDEVRYVDSQLARLFDALVELELLDATTLVVLTADHGEQFGEHEGFEHRDVYIENVHVPLLIRVPGQPGRRVAEPIGLIDVVPTLLEWLGLRAIEGAEGRSRLASLSGEAMPAAPVVTEFGAALRVTDASRSVLRDEQGVFEFYDRERDAGERVDLAAGDRSGFDSLVRALQVHAEQIPEARAPAGRLPGPRERERLEALGYLD